jgi:hypothetical protein
MDLLLGIESADLSPDQQANLRPRLYEAMDAHAIQAGRPVYGKAHDRCGPTPSGECLFPAAATRGAVYVVRNPLDVAVSYAHYSGLSMASAVDTLLRPTARLSRQTQSLDTQLVQHLGDWNSHVDSWLSAPFPVHLVRYEDLLARPEQEFAAIVRFLGRPEGEAAIARAADQCSFGRLRAQEERDGYRNNSPKGGFFFRRGQQDSWRDELPAAEAGRILAACAPTMARLGYPIPQLGA